MPLPAFRDVIGSESFAALDPTQKREVATKYWDEVGAENPNAADYVAGQKANSDAFLEAQTKLAEATPLQQRFLKQQATKAGFNLFAGEQVARGELDKEGLATTSARHVQETAAEDDRLKKTASLFDPKVQEQMAPAFAALQTQARRSGKFGSPSLDARASDLLPGGEKDAVDTSRKAYESLRKQMATDFHLEEAEVDDVIKHQLDLQTEPVSRDAFGTPYIKNEVLAAGADATTAAINNSTLPWSVKQGLVKDLPQRLEGFKKSVVDSVFEKHPELERELGLGNLVEDPTNTETKGNVPAGFRQPTPDEQFAKITSAIHDSRTGQTLGGIKAGLLGTAEFFPGQASGEANTGRKVAESLTQLSGELNQAKTQIWGIDAANVGQGIYSVGEAVAISAMTAGAGAPIAAERIASLGKWGARLANSFNAAVAVSPVAGLAATKSGVQTFEQAKAAGKTDEEAFALAGKSAAIEFGVTTLMSGLHLGGVEDVGGQLVGASAREAAKTAAKEMEKSFGKELFKGIAGEEIEENLITAFDAVAVQAKLNPDMTVDDFKKSLYDTAVITAGISGPASAVGAYKESRKPTYEQSNAELEVHANLALAEATKPGAADPLATGTPAAEAAPPVRAVDPAADGAPPLEPGVGDSGVRDAGQGGSQEAPGSGVGKTTDEIVAEGEEFLKQRGVPTPENDASILPDERSGGGIEPPAASTPVVEPRDELPAETNARPVSTPTTQPDENEKGQRQGRQEVLTPEGDLTTDKVTPETATKEAPAAETVTEPEKPVTKAPAAEKTVTSDDVPAGDQKVEESTTSEKSPASKPTKTVDEGAVPATDENTTGIKNAITAEKRQDRGLPERVKPERRAAETSRQEALKRIADAKEEGRNEGREVVAKFVDDPKLVPDDVENDILVHETEVRERAREAAAKRLEDSDDSNRVDRLTALETAEKDLLEIYNTRETTGTASGRSLQSRKRLFNEDFSLARMLATEQKSKGGGPLSEKDRAEVTALHKELEDVKAKSAAKDAEIASYKAEATFENQTREFRKEASAAKKAGTLGDFLDKKAEEARQRIKERKDSPTTPEDKPLAAGLDPETVQDLKDHAIIGASYLAKKALSLAAFTKQMVAEFGEKIRKHVPEIFKRSKALQKAPPVPKKGKVEKTSAELKSSIEPDTEITGKVIYDLARAHILEGVDGFENVMQAVLADLQSTHPDLTLRDVHDAYSGYGKVQFPSKEEDKVKLREYRTLARLTSQLEDAQKKLAPMKTGPQRDAQTERVRRLAKDVREEMRRQNIKPRSNSSNLRSGLDSMKARLRNAIEDLETAIKEKRPLVTTRTPVDPDEEATRLKDRRDQLRKDYDAIFEKKGLSDFERAKLAVRTLNRLIGEEETMLAAGLVNRATTGPKSSAWTPEIADLKAKLDTLRENRAALRKSLRPQRDPAEVATERAVKALEKANERDRALLASGTTKAPTVAKPPATPNAQIKSLLREQGLLRELLKELREAAKPASNADAARRTALLNNLTKTLRELDRKITTGDLSVKPRKDSSAYDPVVSKIRQAIVRRQETLKEMRKSARPAKDTEAAKIDQAIRRLEKSIKDEEDLAAAGKLKRDPKSTSSPWDARIADLRAKLAKLQKDRTDLKKLLTPQKNPAQVRLDRQKKSIETRIRKLNERIAAGDYLPKAKLPPVMDREKARLQLEEIKVKRKFNERLLQAKLAQRTAWEKARDLTVDVLGVPRAIMTSFDFGAVLRQGGFLTLGDPARLFRSLPANFKALRESGAQQIQNKIEASPFYAAAVKAGLYLAEWQEGHDFTKVEEAYRSRLAKKIPGIGKVIAASERTYVAYLNSLRMDTFNSLARSLSPNGMLNEKEAKVLANFVNIASGRGNLGKSENMAAGLATVFFSPKYAASRFQLIYGLAKALGDTATGFQLGSKETRQVRKLIAWEYGKFLGAVGVIYATVAQAAALLFDDDDEDKPSISMNPRSSDFGKIKMGKTRLDLMAGLSQTTVFLGRLKDSLARTAERGLELEPGTLAPVEKSSPFKDDYRVKFLRTKLSPLFSTLANFSDPEGVDVTGQKVTPETELLGSLLPLSIGDIYSVMQEQGIPQGTILSLLAIFGAGVQTYGKDVKPMEQQAFEAMGVPESRYKEKPKGKSAGLKPPSPPKPKAPAGVR